MCIKHQAKFYTWVLVACCHPVSTRRLSDVQASLGSLKTGLSAYTNFKISSLNNGTYCYSSVLNVLHVCWLYAFTQWIFLYSFVYVILYWIKFFSWFSYINKNHDQVKSLQSLPRSAPTRQYLFISSVPLLYIVTLLH